MSTKISASTEQIKALREQTGAGIVECKRALSESNGNLDEALKILREQGASVAAAKAGRATAHGIVSSYVHGGKIAVLVEVNCESDFVARNDSFNHFVHEVCLQVASMGPSYVSREDVPESDMSQMMEDLQEELAQVDAEVAPAMQQSFVENFYKEKVLLDQPYVKDSSRTIRDLLHEAVAAIRENIVIRRFVRVELGGRMISSTTKI